MASGFTDHRRAQAKIIERILAMRVDRQSPAVCRAEFRCDLTGLCGFTQTEAEAYVDAAWPDLERQAMRIPQPIPGQRPGEPVKVLNPLLAAGAKAQPLPAPPSPPAHESPPPPPKPTPSPTDRSRALAEALAGMLAAPALDEARVISLIREHSQAPPPCPGLTLIRPDAPPTSTDKPIHAYAPLIIALIDAKIPVYLWSGSGTSKTRLVEACAELLKLKYYSDSYTRGMGRAEILGFRDAHGQAVETQLSLCFVNGGLYLADEGDADGIGIIALNRALANDHAVFAGRLLPKHPEFRLCFAANTPGTGQANGYRREPIDAALLDRLFVVELPVDEALEHQAARIGGRCPKAPPCDLAEGGVLTPGEWAKTCNAYRRAAKELSIGTPLTTSGRPLWMGRELCDRNIGKDWLIRGLIRKSRPDDVWNPWRERAETYL